MKHLSKYLVALCAFALFGAVLAGCSGQAASSSASSSAPEQLTPEQLIAELETVDQNSNYKSVTMDMTGSMKMDFNEMFSFEEEATGEAAASGESASAEAAEASEASAEATEVAAEGSEAAAEAAGDESSVMEIPINTHAECDITDGTIKMHLKMNVLGIDMEIYTKGEEAVVVMNGQAASATLEELGMQQFSSVDSIMKTQMGDVDINSIKSSIKTIEKSTEGDETIYKIVCDGKAIAGTNQQLESLSQLGDDFIGDVTLVYHVNAEGKTSGIDMAMTGKGFSTDVTCKLTNYDSTVVPEAPEPTMTYSELQESMGAGLAESLTQSLDGEAVAEEATAEAVDKAA